MNNLMPGKKKTAMLIPFMRSPGSVKVFLQRRTADAPTNPNRLGNFGGAIEERETPLAALMREVKEELDYVPKKVSFFGKYDLSDSDRYVFVEEVGADFAEKVKALEGQYGKFYGREVLDRTDLGGNARACLVDFFSANKQILKCILFCIS
ncbi:MAG: NUDIX domain-containing protein [Candidatus Doudnabacteria bacterium]|nr:NUDIX domain-containing protein [Candidatus Doudnabacteria bacterium]